MTIEEALQQLYDDSEAPDVIDVANQVEMVYVWQVEALLEEVFKEKVNVCKI